MICPKCQLENREGVKFCEECGAKMDRVCPACGAKIFPEKKFCGECGQPLTSSQPPSPTAPPLDKSTPTHPQPTTFGNGRYQVKKFLGEGGKKKVYLTHDSLLDRDVAFALIKTEKLDQASRQRISREAKAMGKLGDHPNIVGIFDMGEENGQPYVVLPLMPGGDVEGLIEKAPERRLPIEQAIRITKAVSKGLEYAHGRGIIHRDIKPGNVWLSADGQARIGDFGLALALELSRLTNEGMMVGTYYYMPPEQAMGGEVTTRADLYSLGAMLYEMVTGRPPFIGDDLVAIIGQHINTPPVSPSWHRPDLPPPLAALIMRLLEKDPNKRPNSAQEILKALEAIEAGKAERVSSQEAEVMAENPLYRRIFVGREPELRQLQSAFDAAASGQGSLTMVVGEPGIGKTAITEQLATYAALRGGKALVGHCYEEGSLSLPYLAFIEALRSYASSRDLTELKKELGPGAPDVARIVSEIRERLNIQPRPQENPEEEKYRLMQAVTEFLGNIAVSQPLMIVLEDLHSADRGTLEMLGHASRNLENKRLLFLGTYRDIEVDRTHPLSSSLADLRRLPAFNRVLLRGLNADEVRRMLDGIVGQEVPWSLAEAVHRQTEGNPLFVQEVVRYLAEEGVFTREKGRWQPEKDTPIEMRIPDGLRDVIGKRLSSLSEGCNRLLSIAAVIGRDFRLDVLQKVAALSDEDLFKALEEARKSAMIEERAGAGAVVNYRFAHAFFRQTLYEEIIAPRRIRLHQQVARALEEVYKNRLEEHAAELAEHFSHSSDNANLAKAVNYGEMAAQRAIDVYAYGEAVRLLDQAIKVQEILGPEDKGKRCDLLLNLCDALLWAVEPKRVLETEGPAAFALAEAIEDGTRAFRACQFVLQALIVERAGSGFATPQAVEWAERADRYAKPDTLERAFADWALGGIRCATGHVRAGLKFLIQAFDLARTLNDPYTLWMIGWALFLYRAAPQHASENVQLAEVLLAGPRLKANLFWVGPVLEMAGHSFLVMGRRPAAEEAWRELRTLAKQTGQFITRVLSSSRDGGLMLLDGRLFDAIEEAQQIRSRGKEAGVPLIANIQADFFDLKVRIYLGRSLEAFEGRFRNAGLRSIPLLCLVLVYLGRKDEVTEILEQWVVRRNNIGTEKDETATFADSIYLESAVLVGHRQAAELLLNRFTGTGVCISGILFNTTCIPRHMGGAAALLGQYEASRSHFQEALKVCTEMKFRPELALTRLQLAELLLEQFPQERPEALGHLDFAIAEFREMKMQPSLERALNHKQILKA